MKWISYPLWAFIVGAILIYSCGGGESHGPSVTPDNTSYVLNWVQEPLYEDNTVMDLIRDVDHYHVYISDYPWFDNNAELAAEISGQDNNGTVPTTRFDMDNLKQFGINVDNVTKFVFMSTETVEGQESVVDNAVQWGAVQIPLEVAVK